MHTDLLVDVHKQTPDSIAHQRPASTRELASTNFASSNVSMISLSASEQVKPISDGGARILVTATVNEMRG